MEVTLRAPPPLGVPLSIETGDPMRLMHGEQLVAEARGDRPQLELDVPAPPHYADAAARRDTYVGFRAHAFPTCFVCGPRRHEGDGLRIFPARRPGAAVVAAAWKPDSSLAGPHGAIDPLYLWSALDCPGYFGVAERGQLALLGRMTARLDGSLRPGERCVVLGWPIRREGRKLTAGTAVFSGERKLVACSRQTWIVPSGA